MNHSRNSSRWDITMNNIKLDCGCVAYVQNEVPYRNLARMCQDHLNEQSQRKAKDKKFVEENQSNYYEWKRDVKDLQQKIQQYEICVDMVSIDNYPMDFTQEEANSIMEHYYRHKLLALSSDK